MWNSPLWCTNTTLKLYGHNKENNLLDCPSQTYTGRFLTCAEGAAILPRQQSSTNENDAAGQRKGSVVTVWAWS